MFVVRLHGDDHGFTLIEIMMVLLIIGIMMSMAVLSVGSQSREKAVKEEVMRLQGLFTLAKREAVFDMQEWGVRFVGQGYEFLVQDEKQEWKRPALDERLLKARTLPRDMPMELQVEGEMVVGRSVKPDAPPQVIFSSDGEMTPFQLELKVPDVKSGSVRFRLTGAMNGQMRMERVVGR
ncbi:MAG: type II secretion system minor pseudopilin GspH [Magnetococcus sp. YQC-5]